MVTPVVLSTMLISILLTTATSVFQETEDSVKVDLNEDEIKEYFVQTDEDADGYLALSELYRWVKIMIDAHLKENIPRAKTEFRSVDSNRDKIVTWDEYRVVMKNLHPEDHHVYTEQEQKHKFRQADENGDNVLNQLEYVAFKNPMTTSYVLKRVALELLEDFDDDKDNKISLDEFVDHKASRVEDEGDAEISKLRKTEFEKVMDLDQDSFIDVKELKDYLDPRGVNFLKNEARHMMHEADIDRDNKLSFEEIKENFLHFQNHKHNPVVRALHDEF